MIFLKRELATGYKESVNEFVIGPRPSRVTMSRLAKTRLGSQWASTGRVPRPMSTYRLKNVLLPRSLALVGASSRQGSVGRAILGNIRKANFEGEFGLVNPRRAEIEGF